MTVFYYLTNYSSGAAYYNGSEWRSIGSVNWGTGTGNISNNTLDISCWNADISKIMLKVISNNTAAPKIGMGMCYNGSTWIGNYTYSYKDGGWTTSTFEEAMYWNISTLKPNGIIFVDSGTTTFSNSNVTVSFFDRLLGDLGTSAIFIFNQISSLLIR